jgi:hypothetical protein
MWHLAYLFFTSHLVFFAERPVRCLPPPNQKETPDGARTPTRAASYVPSRT